MPVGVLVIGVAGIELAGTAVPAQAPLALVTLLGSTEFWRMSTLLALVGLGGGLYSVPLYTLMQLASPRRTGRV
ncbi:hypothetical protein [Salinicola tamaricis]|uniref:hypothetical protein n=1 Tax=Salinicola tamaricis TaxID=1771309 RepID=UPI000D0A115A|nr:hypothetical protein [Salinicola tamaricis]